MDSRKKHEESQNEMEEKQITGCPSIVRCEATGESWQVAWWPEPATHGAGSIGRGQGRQDACGTVLLKRGRLEREEPQDGFFENYTVIC